MTSDGQHLVISQQPPGQVLNKGPSALPGLHPLIHIGQMAGGAPRPGREQGAAPLPVCRAGAKGYDEGAKSHQGKRQGLPSVGVRPRDRLTCPQQSPSLAQMLPTMVSHSSTIGPSASPTQTSLFLNGVLTQWPPGPLNMHRHASLVSTGILAQAHSCPQICL